MISMSHKWHLKKLSEVCEKIVDGSHNPPKGVSRSSYLMLSSKNVFDDTITFDSPRYLSEQDFISENRRTQVRSGDVLLTIVGTVGRSAVVPEESEKFTLQRSVAVLKNKKEIVSSRFLMYFLQSKVQLLINESRGVAQKGIYLGTLGEIPISLPESIAEQERIVKLLDNANDLRQKRKETIKLLNEYSKSIFLEMFGDPLSNPKQWNLKKFGTLGKLDRGVSKHRPRNAPELLGGKHPLIQTGDVANSDIFISTYKSTYSDLGLEQSKKWPKGTLCITIAANIAKTGILEFDACFPDSVVGFVPNTNLTNNIFIHFWMSFLQEMIEKNAPKAAQRNINLKILKELDVMLPPKELQDKFQSIVQKVELIKQNQLLQAKNLDIYFQSLMKNSFSLS